MSHMLSAWRASLGRWWKGNLVLGNYPYGGYLSDKKWHLNEASDIFSFIFCWEKVKFQTSIFSCLGRNKMDQGHQEWIMNRHFFILTVLGFYKRGGGETLFSKHLALLRRVKQKLIFHYFKIHLYSKLKLLFLFLECFVHYHFISGNFLCSDRQTERWTEIIELELCLLIYSHKSNWMISFNRGKIKAIDKTYNSNVSNMYKEWI